MTSPLLALFVRSLREDARLKMTYAARAGLVLVVGVFMIFAVIASGWRGAPGLNFFTAIVHIQTVFITLAGLSYFSSAITEEKEENMLGLLRMTDLNPLSILLGKSTSRLCGALLLLAAQFPFTLLAITLGGITARQIIAAYLALGAYTFFLCNLALLASVVCARTGRAVVFVGAALFGFWFPHLALLPLRAAVGASTFPSPSWFTMERLQEILSTGFDGALVAPQLYLHVGVGLFCFAIALLLFERTCERDSAESAARTGAWLRRRLPPGRVWPRAVVWKDACFIHGGRGLAALKFAGYGAVLGVYLTHRWFAGTLSSPSGMISAWAISLGFALIVFLLELGLAASRIHRLEVQEGTFSSLSLLPMSIEQLHLEKVKSCHHAVLPSLVWVALIFISGVVVGAMRDLNFPFAILIPTMATVFVLPEAFLYFNLVAWLSLETPRFALPLGIAALWLGNFVAGFLGMLMFGIGFIAIPFIAIILAGVFRGKLLARLEELAAEG